MSELLLERESALSAIDAELAGLAGGTGRLVLLDAPAGAGKSRLLAELVHRAGPLRVVRARCADVERDHPFAVPRALFGPLVRGEEAIGEELFAGAAATARDLFEPTGSDALPALSRLYGLFWLTANLAAEDPLVVVVDDVQWADLGSLRFLSFLVERLDDVPVLLALARRTGDVEGERGELLDRLFATPGSRLLPTPALSPAAVATLVQDVFPGAPDELCRRCADATAGNPFLVVELLNELRAAGVDPVGEAAAAVDQIDLADLTRAVTYRLRDLSPAALALARAGAVVGGDIELSVSAAISDLPVEDLAVAADGLVRSGLMAFDHGVLQFAHPLIATAVARSLGEGIRAVLHRRAARALADAAAPPAVASAPPAASVPTTSRRSRRSTRSTPRARSSGPPTTTSTRCGSSPATRSRR